MKELSDESWQNLMDKMQGTPWKRVYCLSCKHYKGGPISGFLDHKCSAFPEGIAPDIASGKTDHRSPVVGDRGIRFEPRIRGKLGERWYRDWEGIKHKVD